MQEARFPATSAGDAAMAVLAAARPRRRSAARPQPPSTICRSPSEIAPSRKPAPRHAARPRRGATGPRFNLGEATVTRASAAPRPAARVGASYILGRDSEDVRLAALGRRAACALMQSGPICAMRSRRISWRLPAPPPATHERHARAARAPPRPRSTSSRSCAARTRNERNCGLDRGFCRSRPRLAQRVFRG